MRRGPSSLHVLPLAFAVALFSSSRAARAQSRASETNGGDGEEEEVLVRGRSAGGFVSEARVETSTRTITDAASLVEPLPGVHVRRLGADDAFATMSIRGASSTQIAVYLAGVPLTGGADPTLDLATLPLWPGARARVFRSFAPAALGRGSLGGTLVLDPPSPRAPQRTDVWLAAGAFGQRRLRIGDVRGDEDGVRVATGLSASRSDDDFSYLDPQATALQGRDVYRERQNAGHAAASGLVSVGLPVRFAHGTGALTSTTLLQGRRQELPGTILAPTTLQRLESSRLVSALELTVPAGEGAFGVRAWTRREGLSLRDAATSASVAFGPTATDDTILAVGTSVGWRGRPTAPVTVEARIDGSAERFAPGTWEGAVAPPSARRSNLGAALDGRVRITDVLVVAASGRTDAWFDGTSAGASTNEVRPTGNVGVEADVGPVALATHAGMLTRPPSFVERYGNRGSFIGEPDLRPESAATIDVGGQVARRLGAVRMRFELAGFATWADDLIVFVPQGAYGRAKATNIGTARLFGIEAEARVALSAFELRASHTALTTANASTCLFVERRCERPALPGRPEHDFVLDLTYTSGPLRLRYGFDVVTGIQAASAGSDQFVVPDRILHSMGARIAVPGAPGLSFALDVRNLFDLRVAEYPGLLGATSRYPLGDLFNYPIPGRRILLSAEWVFPGRERAGPAR